jgi:hypothetical protein
MAYDKTTSLVSSVKGLLFSGISKIKSYIGGAREKSSRKKSRKKSISSESSLGRYKTPMGRSKSRGFSKVVPIDAIESTETEQE